MVNDWVGSLEEISKMVEYLRAQLQWMNAEPQAIIDPI
jgi:hypothetical protein